MDTLIWTVTNLIANLILPPTLFFGLMAIGLWQGGKRRWGRWLAAASLLALVLLSVSGVSRLLVQPFEAASPPLDSARIHDLPKKGAMIVVLGGGRRLGAIEYPGGETLGAPSLERSRYGARLAKATGLPLSVSGGKPDGGNLSEAALMKDFIETELKQPVAIVEDQSFDTRQNAQYILARLAPLKIHTIILVTDVLHMPRAARTFESLGIKVIRAPMDFRATAPLSVMDFLPSAEGLRLSRYVFHELIGEVWYRARRAIAAAAR
ncbi:MAG: YdcF family protein [Betaproteobacteria bacterium]|nr:YdcF family protein [Betaproteobacteria bacterium]MBI2227151.1 YdcF family protein [Betaproteobacteria bacterium]